MSMCDAMYQEYLKKYAEQNKISEEEAEKHKMVQEVKKYYEDAFKGRDVSSPVIGVDMGKGPDFSSYPYGECK